MEYAYSNFMMGTLATIIGMGGVFCILAILTFTTWLLNKIVDQIAPDAPKPAAPAAAPKAAAPAAAPAPAAKNNATIAAIVAAVTMAMGSTELKFKAIERTGAPLLPWAAAGNGNLMGDRARLTEGGNK